MRMSLPTVKGVGTFYKEYGDTKKKHVLFIHGLGSSSIAWGDIPDALSKYFHTITVDLIGSGTSEKPHNADYTIKGFSKFIVDFLIERIGIMDKEHKKISIVGHSLGGYIAAQVAIENKEMIEKLVLIDSSGLLEAPTQLLKDYRRSDLTNRRPSAACLLILALYNKLFLGTGRFIYEVAHICIKMRIWSQGPK